MAPFQEVSAYTGAVFTASAYLRTPPGEPWLSGAQASIRVEFLGNGTNVLAAAQSAALSAPDTNWTRFEVITAPAPNGTTRARFVCSLAKPSTSDGVSIVNFDECSLHDPREYLSNTSYEQIYQRPPLGPFPTNWIGSWLGEGGAVAIRPVGETDNVLWQFTGSATNELWSAIRQQVSASPGTAFRASAYLRTPPGEPWVPGSEAYFRILFLNASNTVLASFQSATLAAPTTNWTPIALTTEPAPETTATVRFTTYLRKPETSNGISVVNFDDASLLEVSMPGVRVSTRAVGIEAETNQGSFELRNTGTAPLTWQLAENLPWLTIPIASGTLAPLGTSNISVTVNRSGLVSTNAIKGTVTLQTAITNFPIDIYMDMPSPAPPALPCEARFYGAQLRVRHRLANGALSEPYYYTIKGSCWSPSSIGTVSGPFFRRQEFAKWYVADIQLLRTMNANTVYVFLDFGLESVAFRILDNLYKNGIKAIVTVDENGSANSNVLRQVVTAYRHHPAILAWAIGNEWNINFYHQTFPNVLDSANATEALARQAKALDPNHPVVAIFGDIDIPGLNPLRKADEGTNQPVSTERIVNDLCPSVDAWGLNIYRGASFGHLFAQWKSITGKPMFFSEFGTDSYRISMYDILDGAEDEAMQSAFNHGLWSEISSNLSAVSISGVCVGGTVFEWNDEWWKAREEHGASANAQENLGFYGGHPDGFANEEWFAVLAADRRPRQAYFGFQNDFGTTVAVSDVDADGMPDVWEYQIVDANPGDSVRGVADVSAATDFDGDGASDYAEYLADTNPLNAGSVLRVQQVAKSNLAARIVWTGGSQATQYLERGNAALFGANWTTLMTNRPPTSATNQFLDSASGARQFYRVRITQ